MKTKVMTKEVTKVVTKVVAKVVAKEVNMLKVELPRDCGRGWKRTVVEIDIQDPALGQG